MMMTREQQRWASLHDWFIKAVQGGVKVKDWVWDVDANEYKEETLTFTDFQELYYWAGY